MTDRTVGNGFILSNYMFNHANILKPKFLYYKAHEILSNMETWYSIGQELKKHPNSVCEIKCQNENQTEIIISLIIRKGIYMKCKFKVREHHPNGSPNRSFTITLKNG